MVNISISNALLTAIFGYAVVFFGIILLMLVILIFGKVQKKGASKAVAPLAAKAEAPAAAPAAKASQEPQPQAVDIELAKKQAAIIAAVICASERRVE